MNRFKNHLMAAAVFTLLAVIGTMMNSSPSAAQAQAGPNVTVVNTNANPVPVTGSTTVSGTVTATISGTPNVNVANPATAPLFFVNVNDPGRIPYQSVKNNVICSGGGCAAIFPAVPAGHRLVVQHYSGDLIVTAGSTLSASLALNDGHVFSRFFLQVQGIRAKFDQLVLAYFDAGQSPLVAAGGDASEADFTLTGYMLDCTVAPCAPIAQ
jgi:hypothetical protein